LIASGSDDSTREIAAELSRLGIDARSTAWSDLVRDAETIDADGVIVDVGSRIPDANDLARIAAAVPTVVMSDDLDPDATLAVLRTGVADVLPRLRHGPLLAERLRRLLHPWRGVGSLRRGTPRVREAHRAAEMITWIWDRAGGRLSWEEGAEKVLGLSGRPLPTCPRLFFRRVCEEDRRRVHRAVLRAEALDEPLIQAFRLIDGKGGLCSVEVRADRVLDGQGRLLRWCGTLRRKPEGRFETSFGAPAPEIDELTGVATLALFRPQIRRAASRARREGRMIAVVLLDLDRFGQINELHGHEAGDRILRQVAERLTRSVRDSDSIGRVVRRLGYERRRVSRLGGDKFVVLLEGISKAREAALVVQRILSRLANPLRIGDTTVSLSARAGVSLYPSDGLDASELLRCAEAAIQRAEHPGVSKRIRFFSKEAALRHRRDIDLEERLRVAAEAGTFRIAYQPKVSLPRGEPIGLEALLRFDHPEHGPVSPLTVIEIAERTGIIHELGSAIFRRVCRDAERIREQTGVGTRLFTNFSPRQLESEDWSDRVGRILEETGVDPNLVGIEITESVLVEDRAPLTCALEKLADQGVEISLDDFGTGYSHLGYLTRLPLHEIKIDRSFVVGLTDMRPGSQEVAALMVILGRSLGIRVVAEGVETEGQINLLQAMGCRAIQGFYFSRPQPLEHFFDGVRDRRIAPAGATAPAV
jgi:diguanylate cyclase (GGDEF)-like protein